MSEDLSAKVYTPEGLETLSGEMRADDGCYDGTMEEKAVRLIYDLYLDGYSLKLIRHELVLGGYRKKSGREYKERSILGILKNRKYAGNPEMLRSDRHSDLQKRQAAGGMIDEPVPSGRKKAIIPQSQFDQVQEEIRKREKWERLRRELGTVFPFVECAYCSSRLKRKKIHNSNQPAYFVWKCARKDEGRASECPSSKAVHEDAIILAFETCFRQLASEETDLITSILKKTERDLEEDDPLIRLLRNETTRKELQETELRLTELLESGQIIKAEYVLRHQVIVQRMNDLIETDQKLKCAGKVRIRYLKYIRQFLPDFEKDQKIKFDPILQHILVEKIVVGNGEDPFTLSFFVRSNTEKDGAGEEILLETSIPYQHVRLEKVNENHGERRIKENIRVRILRSRHI